MWERKAELASRFASDGTSGVALLVIRAEEFEPVVRTAGAQPGVSIGDAGPYVEITSAGPITIDRRSTGVNHAVWYSAVAGLRGRIARYDKDVLHIEGEELAGAQ